MSISFNKCTEKYHSLLKRAFKIIIAQIIYNANAPLVADIIIFIPGFPPRYKSYFKGSVRVGRLRKPVLDCY